MPDCPTDDSNDEPTDLADRHDGATCERDHIQATIEYEVEFTDDQLDDLPDSITPIDFAERVAASRANNELDLTFTIHAGSNTMADEATDYVGGADGRRFRVIVRLSQND